MNEITSRWNVVLKSTVESSRSRLFIHFKFDNVSQLCKILYNELGIFEFFNYMSGHIIAKIEGGKYKAFRFKKAIIVFTDIASMIVSGM